MLHCLHSTHLITSYELIAQQSLNLLVESVLVWGKSQHSKKAEWNVICPKLSSAKLASIAPVLDERKSVSHDLRRSFVAASDHLVFL